LLAAIGEVIERHMIDIGFLAASDGYAGDSEEKREIVKLAATASGGTGGGADDEQPQTRSPFRQCPKCAQLSLIKQEGCDTCTSCAYSKCG